MTLLPSNDLFQPFVGGQMEIQNGIENYVYRGEIETITYDANENTLHVRFAWLGKGALPPTEWIEALGLYVSWSMSICEISDIGPGHLGGRRLCLNVPITGELVVIFPPDGSKLDRSKIKEVPAE